MGVDCAVGAVEAVCAWGTFGVGAEVGGFAFGIFGVVGPVGIVVVKAAGVVEGTTADVVDGVWDVT